MESVNVGPFTVVSLVDASGVLAVTGPEAFPSASEADWAAARLVDPVAFGPDLRWGLDFRCVAIRRPGGRVTLVDVGIGAEGGPAGWAPVPGRLVDALGEVGIAVGDVDTVVLTHLHEDQPSSRCWRRVCWTRWMGASGWVLGSPCCPPGHTVGHQSVVVSDGDDEVIVTGDVLVHAVQLANPDVAYRSESDQSVAADTRRRLLADARTRGSRLATAHLHTGFLVV